MKSKFVDFLPFEKKDKYNLLVVEDKQQHQVAAELQLEGHKYKITTNYTEAIGHLRSALEVGETPDVMLTDMFMPLGNNPVTSDRFKEAPLGYALALYASRQRIAVPRIAIVSDIDHHANAVSATFDDFKYDGKDLEEFYFKGVENRSSKIAIRLNNSYLSIFDTRDLPETFLIDNKVYADQEIFQPEIFQKIGASNKVKNWKAALEAIVNGPVSCL